MGQILPTMSSTSGCYWLILILVWSRSQSLEYPCWKLIATQGNAPNFWWLPRGEVSFLRSIMSHVHPSIVFDAQITGINLCSSSLCCIVCWMLGLIHWPRFLGWSFYLKLCRKSRQISYEIRLHLRMLGKLVDGWLAVLGMSDALLDQSGPPCWGIGKALNPTEDDVFPVWSSRTSQKCKEVDGFGRATLEWHALLQHLRLRSPYLFHPHSQGRSMWNSMSGWILRVYSTYEIVVACMTWSQSANDMKWCTHADIPFKVLQIVQRLFHQKTHEKHRETWSARLRNPFSPHSSQQCSSDISQLSALQPAVESHRVSAKRVPNRKEKFQKQK